MTLFKKLIISASLFIVSESIIAQAYKFQQLEDGIKIYPTKELSGNAQAVQIQFVRDNIVHIISSPTVDIHTRESLLTVYQPEKVSFKTEKQNNKLLLISNSITVTADLQTGSVSFADLNGQPILTERSANGRNILPAVFEGKSVYSLRQTFETNTDDAWYGLGQHQEDAWNYQGRQVSFFQNNTQVAVPFLVSKNNYGILWDNYSLSKVGDTRNYLPLSALSLFDKTGQEGWLTASYANDKNNKDEVYLVKAESEIAYPYLNDTKLKLPKDFAIEKGIITWQGQISSEIAGLHKIKIDYAGYSKVWIDGKLVFDKWRQAWNPGTGVIDLPMSKDKKYSIQIEWIPDGGESYLNFGYLPPVPKQDENTFTFDSEAGRQIDYYFVHGQNIDEVISGYRTLTGKAPIMPKWSMGF